MARPTRDLKRKKYSEPDTDDEFEEEDNDSPHEDEDADEDDEKVGIAKKKSKTSKLGEWIVDDNLFVLKHKNFVADPTGNKVASFDFVRFYHNNTNNYTGFHFGRAKIRQKIRYQRSRLEDVER